MRFLRELQNRLDRWRSRPKSDANAPHYFIDAGYIAIGRDYEKHQNQARSFNERDSVVDMRELSFAHTLLLGVIASMLEDNNGKQVPAGSDALSKRFVITAAFVQGIYLCERAILQGLYAQAGALIRQEFDALSALSELREGKRKEGVAPNAKYAPWKGARHFGELSALTHLSDHRILSPLIGYDTSWGDFASTVPQYKKVWGLAMYARHTAYVLGLVEELLSLYNEMFGYQRSQREADVIDNAFSILVKYETFKAPTEADPSM